MSVRNVLRLWPHLACVLLMGCSTWLVPVGPVVPVDPSPVVVPPGPGPEPRPPEPEVPPQPVDPSTVVPHEALAGLRVGMTRAELDVAMGRPATLSAVQDDGTQLVRWPAVNAAGKLKWLDVQLDGTGLVGWALLPRVQ